MEMTNLVDILKEVLLKEDVRYTKEKVIELLEKYKKDLEKYKSNVKMIWVKFSNLAIGDILEDSGLSDLTRISEASEKFWNKLGGEWNKILELGDSMSEEYDETHDKEANKLYQEAQELSTEYHKLSEGVYVIKELSDDIVRKIEKLKDQDKLDKLKDFRQGIK